MPKRNRDGKVPRRDASDDAARFPTHVRVFGGDLARDDLTVRVPGISGSPLDHMYSFDYVRSSFRYPFTAFLRNNLTQFVRTVLEFAVDIPQILRAIDVREVLPLLEASVAAVIARATSPSVPRWNVLIISPVAGF